MVAAPRSLDRRGSVARNRSPSRMGRAVITLSRIAACAGLVLAAIVGLAPSDGFTAARHGQACGSGSADRICGIYGSGLVQPFATPAFAVSRRARRVPAGSLVFVARRSKVKLTFAQQ